MKKVMLEVYIIFIFLLSVLIFHPILYVGIYFYNGYTDCRYRLIKATKEGN